MYIYIRIASILLLLIPLIPLIIQRAYWRARNVVSNASPTILKERKKEKRGASLEKLNRGIRIGCKKKKKCRQGLSLDEGFNLANFGKKKKSRDSTQRNLLSLEQESKVIRSFFGRNVRVERWSMNDIGVFFFSAFSWKKLFDFLKKEGGGRKKSKNLNRSLYR